MKDDKDPIVDFVDDEEYYEMRRNKQKIENATWAIYIFATIFFIFYLFYLLLHTEAFNWVNSFKVKLLLIYFRNL